MTGRYRIAKGDFKGGLSAFEQAVKQDPQQVAIYREMLQIALRLNRVDDAVRYAQKAVSLNPDDYQLLRWLSRQMIRQQKVPQAIQLLERARKSKAIDHKSVVFINVMRDLGLIYMGTGKAKAAAECFEVVFAALKDPRAYQLDDRSRRALLANPVTSFERMGEVFLAAKRTGSSIQVTASAKSETPASGEYRLRMLLVEERIPMPEARCGIRVQEMVVRWQIDGGDGAVPKDGKFAVTETVSIVDIRKRLTEDLARFERLQGMNFPEKPLEMKSLFVIALVQDETTREVLQAKLVRLGDRHAAGGTAHHRSLLRGRSRSIQPRQQRAGLFEMARPGQHQRMVQICRGGFRDVILGQAAPYHFQRHARLAWRFQRWTGKQSRSPQRRNDHLERQDLAPHGANARRCRRCTVS